MQQKSSPGSSTPKLILAIDLEPIIYPGDAYEAQRFNVWPMDKPPVEGAFDFLQAASEHFEVHVITWRASHWEYLRWWKRFHWPCEGKTGRPEFISTVNSVAPGTFMYIASRVIKWEGVFPSPLELTKFKPYSLVGNQRKGSEAK